MATFIQEGVYLDHTPVSALSQGDVVAIEDDFFGVATSAIAAGVQGALAVQGIFEFVSDGVIAAGALVFWNSETSKVSATPADDCYIGRAVAAAAGNLCRVALNASNIGEFIAIVPASAPTATQSAVSAFTAANPAAITAANPAAVTAADPTVVDPTTDTITGNDYTGQAAIIKLAIEANNTAIKAVKDTQCVELGSAGFHKRLLPAIQKHRLDNRTIHRISEQVVIRGAVAGNRRIRQIRS